MLLICARKILHTACTLRSFDNVTACMVRAHSKMCVRKNDATMRLWYCMYIYMYSVMLCHGKCDMISATEQKFNTCNHYLHTCNSCMAFLHLRYGPIFGTNSLNILSSHPSSTSDSPSFSFSTTESDNKIAVIVLFI
jgi:hypothetical protein